MNTVAKVLLTTTLVGGAVAFLIVRKKNKLNKKNDEFYESQVAQLAKKDVAKEPEKEPALIKVYNANGQSIGDYAPTRLTKVEYNKDRYVLAQYKGVCYLVPKNETKDSVVDLVDLKNYNKVSRQNVSWVSFSSKSLVKVDGVNVGLYLIDTKNNKWITSIVNQN